MFNPLKGCIDMFLSKGIPEYRVKYCMWESLGNLSSFGGRCKIYIIRSVYSQINAIKIIDN